ncbi:hypothetical protein [Xanthomonas floridensis]|uniref:hypothetical protein n=1 Tax=Xanthomonas floridensis TaxID=1843580 RepID=UPI002B218BB0|nr:hypothetical protein [Xanthomonas floridensis]
MQADANAIAAQRKLMRCANASYLSAAFHFRSPVQMQTCERRRLDAIDDKVCDG